MGTYQPGVCWQQSSPTSGGVVFQPSMECRELSRMKQLKEWQQLDEVVTSESSQSFRRILAVHTSTCCQPGKQDAVVKSLVDAGVETPLDAGHNQVKIQLALDKVFVIDSAGMEPVTYCSAAHAHKGNAQEECCKMLLMFCLVAGPQQVKLHPNTLKRGAESVQALREAGHIAHVACTHFEEGTWRHAMTNQKAVDEIVPKPPGLKKPQCGGSAKEPEAQVVEAQVIETLQKYWRQNRQIMIPCSLPPWVWRTLDTLLPRNGLKPFLLRHPEMFEVQNGTGNFWTFTMKSNDHGGGSSKAITDLGMGQTSGGLWQAPGLQLSPTTEAPAFCLPCISCWGSQLWCANFTGQWNRKCCANKNPTGNGNTWVAVCAKCLIVECYTCMVTRRSPLNMNTTQPQFAPKNSSRVAGSSSSGAAASSSSVQWPQPPPQPRQLAVALPPPPPPPPRPPPAPCQKQAEHVSSCKSEAAVATSVSNALSSPDSGVEDIVWEVIDHGAVQNKQWQ